MSEKNKSEINIIYEMENIRIFGPNFVKNNENICEIIINNKEYKLSESYNVENNINNNKLKIKFKGIDNVTNMCDIFYGCSSLSSLPDFSKWNTNNVTNMNGIFKGCHLYLIFLNGILIMLLI